ncbi:AAA family ATPase [Mycolicibacterium sp.]|uniref:AAA family ATPase n=1 Tax=Mycolicibacterium sp. TaxID=2320850 RepID=UPI0025F9890F|nr:AAA family ATPase [Mycolicibacterium sp.]
MTEIDWGDRSAGVEWASSIKPKKQTWLQDNRIPVGTVSALAGRGGTGKTTYGFRLIAQLSRGTLPGKFYGTPRTSLIWSGEDAWDTVIIPRLIAADADLEKVGRLYIADARLGAGESTPKLPLDTDRIEQAAIDTDSVLIFIDPIASTMSGDLNREADVRQAVDALARVADKTGAVVMFVRHFGKGGGNASDKMSGSHAFRDAVRSVFLFAEDGDRVIVTQDKGNYAPKGDESFAFRLESTRVDTDDGPTSVARVVDLGSCDTSVSDVINRTSETTPHDDIAEWLTDLLANGPVKANEVYQAAHAAGHTVDQAKRAKKRLGILAERPVNPGPWFWKLADDKSESTEPAESTPDTPEECSLLPVRSEGVEQSAEGGSEQSAGECSLPDPRAPSPASMPARQFHKPARNRRRTIGGKPASSYPTCIVCAEPVTCGQGDMHLSCSKQREAAS